MSLLDLIDDLFKYAKKDNKHFLIEYNHGYKYTNDDDIFTIRYKSGILKDILNILKKNHVNVDSFIDEGLGLDLNVLKFIYFDETIKELYGLYNNGLISIDIMEKEIKLYLIGIFKKAAERNSLRLVIGRGTVLNFVV